MSMASALPFSMDFLLGTLIGLFVPFQFAMTRFRGTGKWAISKLPQYDPDTDSATDSTGTPEHKKAEKARSDGGQPRDDEGRLK